MMAGWFRLDDWLVAVGRESRAARDIYEMSQRVLEGESLLVWPNTWDAIDHLYVDLGGEG